MILCLAAAALVALVTYTRAVDRDPEGTHSKVRAMRRSANTLGTLAGGFLDLLSALTSFGKVLSGTADGSKATEVPIRIGQRVGEAQ